MEKIKITKEQEEALKSYKIFKEGEKELEYFIAKKHEWKDCFKSLKDFTPLEFSVLLHGWYEVEYPFKAGDWVYDNFNKCYRKLITRGCNPYGDRECPIEVAIKNVNGYIEKIEEPWKIMLLGLGRSKPEFKLGDIYATKSGNVIQIVQIIDNKYAINNFENGVVIHFYPVESRIEVKK